MSASIASLDHDWELAASKSATTQTLSDDDLESFSISGPPSELGDESWEGFEDDNESPLLDPIFEHEAEDPTSSSVAAVERTLLQAALALGTDEGEDDEDVTMSGIQDSESSANSNSTFSFHFPDPLDKPDEQVVVDTYAHLYEPRNESESEAETEDVLGSVIQELSEVKEREDTVVPRKPSFATPSRLKSLFATGVITTVAILAAFMVWNPLHIGTPVLPPPNAKMMELLSTESAQRIPATPTIISTAVRSGVTIAPLIDGKPDIPTISSQERRPLMLEAPPSSGFFIGSFDTSYSSKTGSPTSLSLNPLSTISSSLTNTYQTFSKIILKDLRDVLDLIDELLLFIRGHTSVEKVQETSRSLLDYLAEKVADRHERAKHNARVLREKTMQLAKVASKELALKQETAVENAKHVWNEVKKWGR